MKEIDRAQKKRIDYYPFGLQHKKAKTVVESSNLGQNYKFNGVELENSTGLYEMDFRQFDPTLGRFTSVDPLGEERQWVSTYNFGQNNPISRVDPTGLIDWIPNVDKNGKVSYTAEEGDSAATLQSQYGLDEGVAEQIIGDREIQTGDSVSGDDVAAANGGNQILSLNLASPEGRSEQRRFDQFVFANDLTKAYGGTSFHPADYFSNRLFGSVSNFGGLGAMSGTAFLNVGNQSLELDYDIEIYSNNRYANRNGFEIATQAFDFKGKNSGQRFGGDNTNLEYQRITNSGNTASSGTRLTVKHSQISSYLNRLNRTFSVNRGTLSKLKQ
ncbi:RHS repeat-associated core domain-containing protein [Flavobacteriaceae bacterium]|nr:RHS repeat-associated core domain-containing protein [Flavobacteriaceae bacterium]